MSSLQVSGSIIDENPDDRADACEQEALQLGQRLQ